MLGLCSIKMLNSEEGNCQREETAYRGVKKIFASYILDINLISKVYTKELQNLNISKKKKKTVIQSNNVQLWLMN